MGTLERIKQIMPIPDEPIETGSPSRWKSIEAMVGTELPTDYKEFINAYGSGFIGMFLYLRSPFTQRTYMNLVYQLTEFQSLIAEPDDINSRIPYPIYPKPSGLLPFASTVNGDTLFWITRGSPDMWTLFMIGPRGAEFQQHYDGTIVNFIADLLENKIAGDVISSELINLSKLFSQEI